MLMSNEQFFLSNVCKASANARVRHSFIVKIGVCVAGKIQTPVRFHGDCKKVRTYYTKCVSLFYSLLTFVFYHSLTAQSRVEIRQRRAVVPAVLAEGPALGRWCYST
jgi:hypothetical protein